MANLNIIERYKKIKDGEEGIASKQEELKEKERERISLWYNVDGDELDNLMEEYATDDNLSEYLVDGAVLRCTGATLDDYVIKNYGNNPDRIIHVKGDPDENDKRLRTTLNVSENPASANGLKYATTKDTVMNTNIPPFRCNCSLMTGGYAESEKIRADKTCDQEGVCKHLMSLSDEWENMPLEGNNYLVISNTPQNKAEGITMTSILFCKRGGIIYPETSGQNETKKALDILRVYLAEGKYEEAEVERALQFLAFTSDYALPQYKSRTGLDYNRYDNYILGWCQYYREEMGVNILPDYIKSQIYQESHMGYSNSTVLVANTTRDIMQALDVRNDNIYNYIKIPIDKVKAETKDYGYITIYKIRELNNNYALPGDANKNKQDRCGGIVRALFNTKTDGSGICYKEGASGNYNLVLENVTPIMSIGMGLDLMQELLCKYGNNSSNPEEIRRTYEMALSDYNVGNPHYAPDIIDRVNLGDNFVGD